MAVASSRRSSPLQTNRLVRAGDWAQYGRQPRWIAPIDQRRRYCRGRSLGECIPGNARSTTMRVITAPSLTSLSPLRRIDHAHHPPSPTRTCVEVGRHSPPLQHHPDPGVHRPGLRTLHDRYAPIVWRPCRRRPDGRIRITAWTESCPPSGREWLSTSLVTAGGPHHGPGAICAVPCLRPLHARVATTRS